MILGGYFSDRVSRKLPGGRLAFTSVTALASVPLWLAMLFTSNLTVLLVVNILLYALAILWVGPATADVTEIAGPHLRGLAIGIFFSIVNIAAYGIGSPLIGKVSDLLNVTTNPGQMRYSLLICPAACFLGAIFLWLGSRTRTRRSTALGAEV
jgi:MFS family permease